MIQSLRNPKVIQFIRENLHVNTADLVLASSKNTELPIKEIAVQIESRQRIKTKLPSWYANFELILPRKVNLEQASSEATAEYKAMLFKGNRFLDLTGGSGVDAAAYAKKFKHIVYVEPNEELCELAKHNFKVLGINADVVHSTAEDFISLNNEHFDLVYLDPSRRSDSKSRLVALEDYHPNVIELQEQLFNFTDRIVVKASPMLDIKKSMRQLNHIEKVICLSVDNEMKEVLFVLNKNAGSQPPEIICENLGAPKSAQFTMTLQEENNAVSTYSEPSTYLYDPLTAIRKGGGFNIFSQRFKLEKLAPNTHLYTSDVLNEEIPARIFKVINEVTPSSKAIKKTAKNGYINVISKNYPLSANEIKKKYKINDGGERFLIFCTTQRNKVVLLCEAVSS
ncbi:MAG: class I SAM-dependent methyltransferase [Balneolaceae bacterium]|nr:class I SAM-dependent methyltransferase [Balneolaceae bacterium]